MVSKLKNRLTYFSGIGVIISAILMLLASLVSAIPDVVSNIGTVLFIISTCLMLASTGNRDNISILFSFLTVIFVIIFTIFIILIAFKVVNVRMSAFGGISMSTLLFLLTTLAMIGSAGLTMLTSTVSDNDTIRVLRNTTAGIAVGVAILYVLANFLVFLEVPIVILMAIAQIVGAVIILFLTVLDKQESIETMKVLSIKCSDFQRQASSLQQELEKYKQQEQTTVAQIEQLSKVNQELKTNADYYNQLYVEAKQESLYNQQQLMNIQNNQPPQQEIVENKVQTQVAQPLQNSPIPTIKLEGNNIQEKQ